MLLSMAHMGDMAIGHMLLPACRAMQRPPGCVRT